MVCNKCGAQMADGAMFCPLCGSPTTAPAQPEFAEDYTQRVRPVDQTDQPMYDQPVYNQPVYNQPVYDQPVQPMYDQPMYDPYAVEQPAPKKKKTWLWILIGVLVAAAIAVGVLFATGAFGKKEVDDKQQAEDVAVKYIKAYVTDDVATESSLYFFDAKQLMKNNLTQVYGSWSAALNAAEEAYDADISSIDDLFAVMESSTHEELTDEYGDYSVSAEVTETEEMDEDDLAEMRENFDQDIYDGLYDEDKLDDVSEGYIVTVDVTIDGEDDSDTETYEVTVIKYDGKWKVAYREAV